MDELIPNTRTVDPDPGGMRREISNRKINVADPHGFVFGIIVSDPNPAKNERTYIKMLFLILGL